jgi:hypothetical protein
VASKIKDAGELEKVDSCTQIQGFLYSAGQGRQKHGIHLKYRRWQAAEKDPSAALGWMRMGRGE